MATINHTKNISKLKNTTAYAGVFFFVVIFITPICLGDGPFKVEARDTQPINSRLVVTGVEKDDGGDYSSDLQNIKIYNNLYSELKQVYQEEHYFTMRAKIADLLNKYNPELTISEEISLLKGKITLLGMEILKLKGQSK